LNQAALNLPTGCAAVLRFAGRAEKTAIEAMRRAGFVGHHTIDIG